MKKFIVGLSLALLLASTPSWGVRATYVPDLVVTEPGAVWTDIRAYTSLTAAIADIGATESTLLISKDITLGASVVIPSTITLKNTQGSVITLGAYNLTIQGALDVPPRQIFNQNSTGEVINDSSQIREAYAEWWGADASDSTDDLAAVQAAIDFMQGKYSTSKFTSGKVQLLGGTYTIAGTIDIDAAVIIQGEGRTLVNSGNSNETVLRGTTDASLITVTADDVDTVTTTSDDQWFSLRDLNLYTTVAHTTPNAAIYSPDANNNELMIQINDVNIWGTFWNGIRSVKTAAATAARVFAKNMFINDCEDDGIYLRYGDMAILENISITKCEDDGVDSTSLAIRLVNCETFGNGGYGVRASDVQIVGGYYNNDNAGGIYISGTTVRHGSIVGASIEYAGDLPAAGWPGGSDNTTAVGLTIDDTANGTLMVNGCWIYGSQGRGVEVNDGTLLITTTTIQSPGQGAQAAHLWALYATTGGTVFMNACNLPSYGIYTDAARLFIDNNLIASPSGTAVIFDVNGANYVSITNNQFVALSGTVTTAIDIDATAAGSSYVVQYGNNYSGTITNKVLRSAAPAPENITRGEIGRASCRERV